MPKKYYAVRKGRINGIYKTWKDCKEQVDGFKSAEFKSFNTLAEAEKFMDAINQLSKSTPSKVLKEKPESISQMIAYVDGSYDHSKRAFSYGAVLLYMGETLEFCEKFTDPKLREMRNVAGEIMGSTFAIQYCIDHGITNLLIYYDYEGIEKWACGDWKANKLGTRAYADFCNEAREFVQFSFVKVKAHSGIHYNEVADMLAKEALGLI